MSCYDDFVYVKEAMKFGIDDYLLKNNLTENTLLDVLNKIFMPSTRRAISKIFSAEDFPPLAIKTLDALKNAKPISEKIFTLN